MKTSWHLLSPFESLFQTHHFLIGQQVMQSYVIQIKRCLAWVCNSFAYKSGLGSNKQLLHVHYLRYDKKTWNLSEWLWRFKWWQLLYWSFNSVHNLFLSFRKNSVRKLTQQFCDWSTKVSFSSPNNDHRLNAGFMMAAWLRIEVLVREIDKFLYVSCR